MITLKEKFDIFNREEISELDLAYLSIPRATEPFYLKYS